MRPDEALAFAREPKRGAVVIGDPALEHEGKLAHTLDLATAWRERTGLPFVFAAWYARKPLDARAGRALAECTQNRA